MSSDAPKTDDQRTAQAVERLYERSIAEQWHVVQDVEWGALDIRRLGEPIRRAMRAIYSHTYHAESYGLGLVGRLVDVPPAGRMRQFAATQVMDEARHVDFFSRVLKQLEVDPEEPPQALMELSEDASRARDDVRILLYGQIIENSAQTLFLEGARASRERMKAGIRLPGTQGAERMLDYIVRLVGRDEARHIAFGQQVLAARMGRYSAGERRVLEQEVGDWSLRFNASFSRLEPSIRRLGLPAEQVLHKAHRSQRLQFRRLGLDLPDPADLS